MLGLRRTTAGMVVQPMPEREGTGGNTVHRLRGATMCWLLIAALVLLLAACQDRQSPSLSPVAVPSERGVRATGELPTAAPAASIVESSPSALPTAAAPGQATPSVMQGVPGAPYQVLFTLPVGEGDIRYRGAGAAGGQIVGPNTLAVLPDFSFVIGDPVDNRLLRYDPDGTLVQEVDLYALGIVNVSDLVATPAELYLLEIGLNVAPERWRVSRLSFDGEMIANYDIPPGCRFEDGLWGIAPGESGGILLELGGASHRFCQLVDAAADQWEEVPALPAYGRLYQVHLSADEPSSITLGAVRVASQFTVGNGLLRILQVRPDGGVYLIREDMVSDAPVIQGDQTVHYLTADGEQVGVARYPLAEWAYWLWRNMAVGPDGHVYALLPRLQAVQIVRLNFCTRLEPLLSHAAQPVVTRSGEGQ